MKSYGKPKKLRRRGKLSSRYYVRVWDRDTGKDTYLCTHCTDRKAAEAWVRKQEQIQFLPKQLQSSDPPTFAYAYEQWLLDKECTVSEGRYVVLKTRPTFSQKLF